MHSNLSCPGRVLRIAVATITLVAIGSATQADIFQWEYINPADPTQGKQHSTTLAPGGAGVDAVPGADLSGRNLTMAYLVGADMTNAQGNEANMTLADLSQAKLSSANLTSASFYGAVLTDANLSQANLTNASFLLATLKGANFTNAQLQGSNFFQTTDRGFTASQLYSTTGYQAHDLTGINLGVNDLSSWNFKGQNLTQANFTFTMLAGADFTGADVRGANFKNFYSAGAPTGLLGTGNTQTGIPPTGITLAQVYSTASYRAHDLTGIGLSYTDLSGAIFIGQNLTNVDFAASTLTDADFAGADVRGTSFAGTGITLSQLYSTISYQSKDLRGIDVAQNNLAGGNFAGQNLTAASFYNSTLADADFAHAVVRDADFGLSQCQFFCFPQSGGLTLSQLYSTSSYRDHDLTGIGLYNNRLAGANFAGQNLTNASFNSATLIRADLTAADVRGARFVGADLSGAIAQNLIWIDGRIHGVDLISGGLLVVRDYDGDSRYEPTRPPIPITVDQHFAMGPGGTLRMVFEADAWDSTISFAPGIPVALGGTLELAFAADVNLASQIGRTFHIFDWTGVAPAGALTVSSPYRWDLSQLYTTGKVTLTAIPEPTALILLFVGFVLLYAPRRGRFVLSVVLISGCVPSAFAALPMTGTYIPELQAVDVLLQNFMMGKPIPGGTIAITHDDQVIYERGIGYSNEARTIPVHETAMMRLASVSKPITASAIQQLAKDGQLSLDDKVFNIDGNGGILNITPYNGTLGDSRLRDITLQHLLEHKGGWNSGIAGDMAFQDLYIATTIGVPSPPGFANSARYILSRPLQFNPGSAEYYSNIGYMFLGMVVEAASGQAYESYVENHVLAPAGIPAWEIDAGRTFAENQNPREPVYSSADIVQNVYNPGGPLVSGPYGGWDHEKALAYGGLIASSKAIALLAQSRIASGPDVGKLRSESTTNPQNIGGQLGALPGTLTLMVQESSKDWTYSILFDQLPAGWSSDSISLFDSLNQILDGLTTWPEALVYAGDFTNDQWLTLDDVMLFKQALALGSQTAFTTAYPLARYGAGDFDGDGQVNASDAVGLVSALQHAGVPAEFTALVPELPGDYNRDGGVDAADYVVWRDNVGATVNLPNEVFSLGVVDESDYEVWRSNFGNSRGAGSGASPSAKVPEPSALFLVAVSLVGIGCCYPLRRRPNSALQFLPAIFPFVAFAAVARADIYQWEYINPADPSQGKRQSATLAPDGADVFAMRGANLSNRNLTKAHLIGADLSPIYPFCTPLMPCSPPTVTSLARTNLTDADLTSANLYQAYVVDANLRNANLTNADFSRATLTNASFAGAEVLGARFVRDRNDFYGGSGISLAQLYSTASYQAQNLSGIGLGGSDFSGANFAGQNLSSAWFSDVTLTDADFRQAKLINAKFGQTNLGSANLARANFAGADLTHAAFFFAMLTDADFRNANLTSADFRYTTLAGANFAGAAVRGASLGITLAQLYSTASYQARDLQGARLSGDFRGGNFAGQNLTNATLSSNLTGADLTDAVIREANLSYSGLNLAQLYSTASYQSHDLSGTALNEINLAGGDFSGHNLTNAHFYNATLIGADFNNAHVQGADFSDTTDSGFASAQFYSTASYQSHELTGVALVANDLTDWNFAGQNLTGANVGGTLTNANFSQANLTGANVNGILTGANFSGAEVRGASLSGIATTQLYSTASYQAHDLAGIKLNSQDINGANFASQNLSDAAFVGSKLSDSDFKDATLTNAYFNSAVLTGSNFRGANLANARFFNIVAGVPNIFPPVSPYFPAMIIDANLTAADARGALGLDVSNATTTNLIRPDGHIRGLDLHADDLLVIRDHDGNPKDEFGSPISPIPIPITIDEHLAMDTAGKLRLLFEADDWNSTISFAPGIPVALGGTLELAFAADVNPASQLGRTFHVFDWNGVTLTGTFAVTSPYAWDLSSLYTTGEVTLTAIPEPSALMLFGLGLVTLFPMRRIALRQSRRPLRTVTTLCPLVALAASARADIFQWEYVDPYHVSHDKRQSTTLLPDGAGVDAVPGTDLSLRNLSKAYLPNALLNQANLSGSNLTFAYLAGSTFRQGNLSNVDFGMATLTDVDFTGAEIRGAEFVTDDPPNYCCLEREVGSGITIAQLYSTASYQAGELIGINFDYNDLAGGNFSGQNVANASFLGATLTGALFNQANGSYVNFGSANLARADFSKAILPNTSFSKTNLRGAILREANLANTDFTGFVSGYYGPGPSPEVYATLIDADFSKANLTNARFGAPNMSGVILREANLTNTYFRGRVCSVFGCYEIDASLTDADLTGADAQGAQSANLSGSSAANLILPDGHVSGLDLDAGSRLVVRDYDGDSRFEPAKPPIRITVDQHLAMGPGGTLRMVFEADEWGSTISFAPGIRVTLGGTLELTFAADVNPAAQLGRTFGIFDWTGVNPTGAFVISSPYAWDLSNLYTTGEVTLTAVPEPATMVLLLIAVLTMNSHHRAGVPKTH